MYFLQVRDIVAAGLDPTAAETPLQLVHRGRAVPYWLAGDTLQFYAAGVQSRYTTQNVYWLVQNTGDWDWLDPVAAESPAEPQPPVTPTVDLPLAARPAAGLGMDSYLETVVLEQNDRYDPQAEGDRWLWTSLAAPNTQSFELELPDAAPGAGWVQLVVYGSTESPQADPDHHLRLAVNGRVVADESWDGKGRRVITGEVPEGLLQAGRNEVTVEAPGDTGVLVDITFIDRLEFAYPRYARPLEGQVVFYSPGGEHRLEGFGDGSAVYDVSDPYAPTRLAEDQVQSEAGLLVFTGQTGHRYAASRVDGYRVPSDTAPLAPGPDLRRTFTGADYLALGPSDLLAELQPLLELRQAQGLQTAAVPLGNVYDQFGGGFPEPAAIQAFLQHAYDHGEPRPRFVLLVGDGTYDLRGYQAPPEANRLPVIMVDTVFGGETASDVMYVQMDADGKPDLAVGRIPAQTPEQVRVFVEKTLAHEREIDAGAGGWPQSILAVADGQDASFRYDAEVFLDLFPEPHAGELIAPEPGDSEAHREIASRWAEGPGRLVAYFGHGSLNMWGKDRLFTVEDVAQLPRGASLPVVMNMTCLNGLFTHPTQQSLAEALLWRPDGGAVAVLAPTSLTLPVDQSFLSRPLVEALLDDPALTLGEALLAARRSVPIEGQGSRDVMNTFLLFGDPALRLNSSLPGEAGNQ